MKMVTLIYSLVFVLTSTHSEAGINWSELQKEALASNGDIVAKQNIVESKHYLKNAAWGGYLPQISLFADETRRREKEPSLFFSISKNAYTIDYSKNKNRYQRYGIQSSINLFNGFSTTATASRASYKELEEAALLNLKKVSLRFELAKLYSEWLVARKSEQMSTEILKRQKQNRELIKIKYNNGMEARWALDLADSMIGLAEQKLNYDKASAESSAEGVNQLIKKKVDLEVDESFVNFQEVTVVNSSFENHPQVQLYTYKIKQFESEKTIARSGFLPILELNHQWQKSRKKGEDFSGENVVSLNLTWNIFDGFYTTNSILSTNAGHRAALANELEVKSKIELDLTQAARDYNLALSFYHLKKSELRAITSRADVLSNQYRNGLRSYADWESAQTKLTEVEREFIDSERQVLVLKANYEKILGKSLGDI